MTAAALGREAAHVVAVATGWQRLPGPLVDKRNHRRRWLSAWELSFFSRHGFARCWKCSSALRPLPGDDRFRPLILWSKP